MNTIISLQFQSKETWILRDVSVTSVVEKLKA